MFEFYRNFFVWRKKIDLKGLDWRLIGARLEKRGVWE